MMTVGMLMPLTAACFCGNSMTLEGPHALGTPLGCERVYTCLHPVAIDARVIQQHCHDS